MLQNEKVKESLTETLIHTLRYKNLIHELLIFFISYQTFKLEIMIIFIDRLFMGRIPWGKNQKKWV